MTATEPVSADAAPVPSIPRAPLPFNLRAGLARSHLSGLDGLRAIAAFLVVFEHAGFTFVPAGLGVLAFFVLSGFLITWLLIGEEDRAGSISLSRFYLRRGFRIFPAFYVYFLVGLSIIVLLHKELVVPQVISALLYATNYYQALQGDPNTWLSHTWSLAVEEQFYLLWPLTFLLLRHNTRRFRVLVIAIPVLWLYRWALVYVFHVSQGYVYEAFDTRADHLLIGCFLAISFRESRLPTLWKMLCSSAWLTWLVIGLLATCVYLGYVSAIPRYRDTIAFVVEPVLIFFLIGQLIAFGSHPATALFNWPWVRYLGRLSYSIYLYQQLFIYAVMRRLPHSPILGLTLSVLIVVGAAACSYHFVEQPFLRMRRKYT